MAAADTPKPNRADSRKLDQAKRTPFTFQDKDYTVPPRDKWPFTVIGLLNNDRIEEGLTMIIGEEQTKQLVETPDLTVGDVNAFFDVMKKAAGSGN